MEARNYRAILLRRWLTVLLVTLLTLAVTVAVTLSMTKRFTASTQLFFGVRSGSSVTDLAQGSAYTEDQMRSYAVVATSPIVLKRVINELNLSSNPKDLAKFVKAEAAAGTVILQISVSETDPAVAAAIANSIAKQVVSVAGDLVPDGSNGKSAVRATVLAEATVPQAPSSPVLSRNLVVGLVLGLLLGIGAALAKDFLDTRIRTEYDLRRLTASPLLGVISRESQASAGTIKSGAWAEAVLRLRLSLESVANRSQVRPIVITSAIAKEGKSTTALGLATSAADAGLRVLLIDGDLRQSSLAGSLGLTGGHGLTSVLTEGVDVASAIQRPQDSKVDVMASGPQVASPSELLATKAMSSLLGRLSHSYDLVLIDSPPLLQVPDAVILGRLSQGLVLVVGDRLHRAQLRSALHALAAVEGNLLGILLNKAGRRRSKARTDPSRIIEWELPPEGSSIGRAPHLSPEHG